jgi:DNA-directed RNA polymerase specialized sigma24 family protein
MTEHLASPGMNATDGVLSAPSSSYYGTTLWTEIIQARAGKADAWETLVARYRHAIHTQIEKHFKDDPENLTGEFIAVVFAQKLVPRANRTRGRFRGFLADALRKFICSEWRKRYALKHGGSAKEGKVAEVFSLDEENHAEYPDDSVAPEDFGRELDRAFAWDTFNHTVETVRTRFISASKENGECRARKFELLIGSQTDLPIADIARELGMTEGAVRISRHRLKGELAAAFRAAVADTSLANEVEGEISYLLGLLA